MLTATAAAATIGDPATFSSGRQFAAWLGLVPRQTGTGGRVRQLGLSKRGDVYLRTLLMHGARAIIARSKHSPWIEELLKRRPYSVAVAALANKLARTIWAVLFHHTPFDPSIARGHQYKKHATAQANTISLQERKRRTHDGEQVGPGRG